MSGHRKETRAWDDACHGCWDDAVKGSALQRRPCATANQQRACASTCFRLCESTQTHRTAPGTQLAKTTDGHPGLLQRTLTPRAGKWRAQEVSQRMGVGGLLVGERFARVVLYDIVDGDNDTLPTLASACGNEAIR